MRKRIRSRVLILAFVGVLVICAAPFCGGAQDVLPENSPAAQSEIARI